MKYLIFLLVALFSPWTYHLFPPKVQLDQTIWQAKDEEIFLLNERRSYYPHNLGRIFQNKPTLILHKLERNFFQNLDPNLYFFATHPRERVGFVEFEKYPYFFLPFFIYGLFLLLKQKFKLLLIYGFCALVLSTLFDSRTQGPILIYPFITVSVSLGILGALKWFKRFTF